jgi:hypothetical protein
VALKSQPVANPTTAINTITKAENRTSRATT